MDEGKSSISGAQSYKEIGEYWDTHDLAEVWDQTHPVEFTVNIQSQVIYFAVDSILSERVRSVAKKRGVSSETLLNLWLQEKLLEESA